MATSLEWRSPAHRKSGPSKDEKPGVDGRMTRSAGLRRGPGGGERGRARLLERTRMRTKTGPSRAIVTEESLSEKKIWWRREGLRKKRLPCSRAYPARSSHHQKREKKKKKNNKKKKKK